jgi:RimJ/RimL family protein N-acetyltransferase
MLETKRLLIRLMEERDIELVRKLHNEESTLNRLTDPFHVSQEEQILWFKKISTSRTSKRYVLELKETNEICGVIRLDGIDSVNRCAVIGADVHPNFRSQGFATEAYLKIIDYLFSTLGLHRLQLFTLETNTIAIGLYAKIGFKPEGYLREAIYREGRFVDLVVMGMLQFEWQKRL